MTIHRRTLLKSSLPALAGSMALGAVMDITAIEQLYSRWEEASAKYKRATAELDALLSRDAETSVVGQFESEVVDPAYAAVASLEDEIIALRVKGPRDLAIKVVIALHVEGVHDLNQCRRLHADASGLLT